MDIKYYLGETEVQKAYFKRFSSRCHEWIKIMDEYNDVFACFEDTLTLVYTPARNEVTASYNKANALLDIIYHQTRQTGSRLPALQRIKQKPVSA